jgi:hypothetical protein
MVGRLWGVDGYANDLGDCGLCEELDSAREEG